MDDVFGKIGLGVVGGVIGIIVVAAVAAILTFPTMWLWNWLMPTIFSLPKLGFYQVLGLMVLSGLLLGRVSSKN